MKIIITYILLLLSVNIVFAQGESNKNSKPEKPEKEKTTWKERRSIMKEYGDEYLAWERKHFNSPGKWYMAIEGGYGWPFLKTEPELVPPLLFLGNSDLTINNNGTSLNKLLMSSQGEGLRMGITLGKMFNRFVGFEGKIGYFISKEDNLSKIKTPYYNSRLDTRLSELSLSPSLVLQSPNMNNWYVVGKIGPYIPFWGNPTATAHINDRDGTLLAGLVADPVSGPLLEGIFEGEFAPELLKALGYQAILDADVKIDLQQDFAEFSVKEILRAIGVSASLGFRYQPSPILSVFGEIAVKGYNISLAGITIEDLDAKVTILDGALTLLELNEEGGKVLGSPSRIRKEQLISLLETNFVNELTHDSNNPYYNYKDFDEGQPRDELAPRLSVVSVGFNVGLQINFPGKHVYYREGSRKARK